MYFAFRWIEWNTAKVEKHGLTIVEVEYAVENAETPYPISNGNDKWLVIEALPAGMMIQVIYLIDDDGFTIFVIHARPLTNNETRRERKRRK